MARTYFGVGSLVRDLLASHEFSMLEGTWRERLEQIYYLQLGGVQYPLTILLKAMDNPAEQYDACQIIFKDIKIDIVDAPACNIKGDMAIIGQDIYRSFCPDVENDVEPLFLEKNFKPLRQGEVLLSSPFWCKARYLSEAVIYRFESLEMSNAKIIEQTLSNSLSRAENLDIEKLIIEPLGTEMGSISYTHFVEILYRSLNRSRRSLKKLRKIIIAVYDQKQKKQVLKFLDKY